MKTRPPNVTTNDPRLLYSARPIYTKQFPAPDQSEYDRVDVAVGREAADTSSTRVDDRFFVFYGCFI